MQSTKQTTEQTSGFGSFFNMYVPKDKSLDIFAHAQLDNSYETKIISKYEYRPLMSSGDANDYFQNLINFLGMNYSFVVQTNLEILQKLTFATRRDLGYKLNNLRIIHVINSNHILMEKYTDPYFICAKANTFSGFGLGFGINSNNPGIEFSVFDMHTQKYVMLHYVSSHDMFQNNMSFDYNDYYFGNKRKADIQDNTQDKHSDKQSESQKETKPHKKICNKH